MINADARSQFTAADLSLLIRAVGGADSDRDTDLIRDGLDAVLDRPELRHHLLGGPMPGPSPSLLFYVLVRHALLSNGLDDRPLADYCAALLRDFGVRRRANQVDDIDDHEHHYLVDLLIDLEQSTGPRQYKVLVHLGNHALWLSGIFPDRIAARQSHRGGPGISYYENLGQRGFAEASEHQLAEWTGLDGVFHRTADHFPHVRRALNQVRRDLKLAA